MVKDDKLDSKKEFAFTWDNYKYLIIGFAIIVVGFLLMIGGASDDPNVFNGEELFSFRRITLSPIVVMFGFVFVGYAIMKKPKENS